MEIFQTVDPKFLSTTVLMMYINTGVRCDICIFECRAQYKWENIADCDSKKHWTRPLTYTSQPCM